MSFEQITRLTETKLEDSLNAYKVSYALYMEQNGKVWNKAKSCGRNSQFYIGSITKQMTCLITLSVLEKMYPRQKLPLVVKRTLAEAFPKSATLAKLKPVWATKLTPYDLMTNRSGLIWNETKLPLQHESFANSAKYFLFDEKMIGTYQYSDLNFYILANMACEAMGKTYEELLKQFITSPARMASTVGPSSKAVIEEKATRLVQDPNPIEGDFAWTLGAGNVISTPADMLRFSRFLHTKLTPKISEIMMMTEDASHGSNYKYGLGLMHGKDDKDLIWHGGMMGGMRAFAAYKKGLSVVLLSNDITKFEIIQNVVWKAINK